MLDFVAPLVPLGLFCGRIGNFINGELRGRISDVEWAMVFPGAGELPRHPTQLYEAGLEGLLLFLVLWTYSRKPRPLGAVSGLFAVGYSLARITVEFFRMPDPQMGYLYGGWLTMGQVLCLPLLFAGLCLLCYAWSQYKNPSRERVELEDGSVIYIRGARSIPPMKRAAESSGAGFIPCSGMPGGAFRKAEVRSGTVRGSAADKVHIDRHASLMKGFTDLFVQSDLEEIWPRKMPLKLTAWMEEASPNAMFLRRTGKRA